MDLVKPRPAAAQPALSSRRHTNTGMESTCEQLIFDDINNKRLHCCMF